MFASSLAPGLPTACAVAPALLLLWLVIAGDSRPEPPRVVWMCVLFGALSVVPAVIVELWLMHHLPSFLNPLLASFENALLIAAVPEETVKIAIIAAVALRSREFDEPMDGVVYGTAVGLGFAAVENFFYVTGSAHFFAVAALRGILSVPFHGALGAIAGAYLAGVRFGGALGAHRHDRGWRVRRLVAAWVIPVILHSLFDGAVFSMSALGKELGVPPSAGISGLILLMLVVWFVAGFGAIALAVRLARRIAHRQKAYLNTKRLPPTHWRAIWGRTLCGVGLSIVGIALIVAGDLTAKVLGLVALAIAVAISAHCAKYLNEVARQTHRPVTADRIAST